MQSVIKMSFNMDIARDIGTDAAIILENILYWIAKNEANKQHFHDGTFWTYNSLDAFEKLFPWLTSDKIRRHIEKLEQNGLIRTGNYNENQYDRTKWYSVPKPQMHLANSPNGTGENAKSIVANNKPDNKQKEKIIKEKILKPQATKEFLLDLPTEFIKELSLENKLPPESIVRMGKQAYNWCEANGRVKKNYAAFLRNWVDNNVKYSQQKPKKHNGPITDF